MAVSSDFWLLGFVCIFIGQNFLKIRDFLYWYVCHFTSAFALPGNIPGVATPDLKDVAIGLNGLQSSKKPIRDCFSFCRPFLNWFTVVASNMELSKLFHRLTSRSAKNWCRTSNLDRCLLSLYSCPLRYLLEEKSNIDSIEIPERPLHILNTCNEINPVTPFLQTPKSQTIKPITVW